MPVIAVLPADEVADDVAPTTRSTPGEGGGHVPYGCAGYVYDGAAYCPECAAEANTRPCAADGETYTVATFPANEHDVDGFGVGVVDGMDEWDYPGASCHICHTTLDTNVLIYDDGGAHPWPPVRVLDPDRHRDPVTGFLLEDPGDAEVRIMLAEDFGSHGDAGDTSWVPRDDVQIPNDE